MQYTISNTDVRRWCEKWKGESFHALLADPPYGYAFKKEHWDNDVALQKTTWEGFYEHLLPGAWGCVYSSPQLYHRVAVAIEDAGFRIHPLILNWFSIQGFPKATQVKTYPSHYYGGQVLRNSVEPILVFQRPRPTQASINATGAGALNIDAARQPTKSKKLKQKYESTHGHSHSGLVFQDNRTESRTPHPEGYWPTNVLLTCTSQCNLFGHDPACPTVNIEEQGASTEGFFNANFDCEILEEHFPPLTYSPKATRYERDLFLDNRRSRTFTRVNPGGLSHDPRWKPISVKNDHPTVKPLSLSMWLAALLLPPAGFTRRLLNPFGGSGTEIIGALLADWDHCHSIEQSRAYKNLALHRLRGWQEFANTHGTARIRSAIKTRSLRQLVENSNISQQTLFT